MSDHTGYGKDIHDETTAVHSSLEVPIAQPAALARDVRYALEQQRFESASHIVVCEKDIYIGIISIEDLLVAADTCPVSDLIDPQHPVVGPEMDREMATWYAVREKKTAIPVVNRDGRFMGLITPHQLMEVLLSEHEEDLSRHSGLLKSTFDARFSSEETVTRRIWHRLPWLLIGLAGALLSADFVGWFEAELSTKIALAFFIPGIVYMADAVGTQTETIVIRGLSVGIPIRKVLRSELLAGLAMGFMLALIAGPLIWWRWGDLNMVFIVALSLFAACTISTVIAMGLPWIFNALGRDPAFGSGPLATIIQDLLSILIYFYIAFLILS